MMDIQWIPAKESDAETISALRQQVWATTYRGIYPDEMIDCFDFPWHIDRDRARITDPQFHVYLIASGDTPIGYVILRHAEPLFLQSLYLLSNYQRQGIGRQVFALLHRYCQAHHIRQIRCQCHPDNENAMRFYQHMGGHIVAQDTGNAERYQDSVTFAFEVSASTHTLPYVVFGGEPHVGS